MSRIWFDTEFIETRTELHLVSIGLCSESGYDYYAEVVPEEVPWHSASPWVNHNVKPLLYLDENAKNIKPKEIIKRELMEWCGYAPVFWSWYAACDWMLLCGLFGGTMGIPSGHLHWPQYCLDLKQLCYHLGNPRMPEKPQKVHHALEDARWVRAGYNFLVEKWHQDQTRTLYL